MVSIVIAIYRSFYIPAILFFYLVLLYPFKKSYKRRLVKALESCGPVFIKCGQSISLKPYLFSSETVEACSSLQDRVSPSKLNLKKEIGKFYDDFVFESFTPIASGSIASVYKAKLGTGEVVAVKILRKNVRNIIKSDIFLLKVASYFLEFIPVLKKFKLKAVTSTIEDTLLKEIDFKIEEENLYKLKANLIKIREKVRTPRVFTKYTSHNLLVTEFIFDIPISNIKLIEKAGLSKTKIAKTLVEIYLEQVYEDGFFHADFHPGNLFVNQKYQITLIDFGIVSTISYKDRIIIARILNGFLNKDYNEVLSAHIDGGYINQKADLSTFKQDLERIGEIFIHSEDVKHFSISGILIELFRIMEKYSIEIKEDLLLLYKTIFFVEAVVMKLDSSCNIWSIIKPWMKSWKARNMGLRSKVLRIMLDIQKIVLKFIQNPSS